MEELSGSQSSGGETNADGSIQHLMSEASGSQSSGGERNADGSIPIPFILHKGIRHRVTGIGSFLLEMPSGQEDMPKIDADRCPKLNLLLNDGDKNQEQCLKIMQDLNHENVLRVEFWKNVKDQSYIRVYVEPYSGILSKCLVKVESLVHSRSNVVPSQYFEELVSQAINGLDYIIQNGHYHGNFSWKTTLYHMVDGNIIVKLANFERKNPKDLLQCQVEDLISLGASLEAVSQHVKNLYVDISDFTCYLIDDLAMRLKSVTNLSVHRMKHDLEDHVFFWNEKRMKTFFAYEVPKIWNNPAVKQSFSMSPSMPTLPWTATWTKDANSQALMAEMVAYRQEIGFGVGSYDGQSVEEFFRFISGMYTHENVLRQKVKFALSVDDEVRGRHPRLSFDLNVAIRGAV